MLKVEILLLTQNKISKYVFLIILLNNNINMLKLVKYAKVNLNAIHLLNINNLATLNKT